MLSAIGVVGVLAWRAISPLKEDSQFSRNYISIDLEQKYILPTSDVTWFCGKTEGLYYFQTKNPSKVLVTDHYLKNIDTLTLGIPNHEKMSSGTTTIIDSPYVTVFAGRLGIALKTEINRKEYSLIKMPGSIFTRGILINQNLYVIRGVDSVFHNTDQIFMKLNSYTNKSSKEKNISENNGDAGISTDGLLNYDKETGKLIYTFFYDNKFLCFDSSLRLNYKASTIDKTKIIPIHSTINENVITTNTPKRIINSFTSVWKGYIFNYSSISGANEPYNAHAKYSAIDIYEIKSGAYKGSLKIPTFANDRLKYLFVLDDGFIGIYKSEIIHYKLDPITILSSF